MRLGGGGEVGHIRDSVVCLWEGEGHKTLFYINSLIFVGGKYSAYYASRSLHMVS